MLQLDIHIKMGFNFAGNTNDPNLPTGLTVF
jgi:hypothetical protein